MSASVLSVIILDNTADSWSNRACSLRRPLFRLIRHKAGAGIAGPAGTTPQVVARKCKVILLASAGVSNNSIAQQTGLSRPTVIATRTAFARGGVEAIRQRQKRKRSRRVLTPELQRKILDTTLQTRPPDATPWSVRTMARHLGVTRTLVHGVWQRFDVQPHRVETFKLSNDPRFEEKVRDVVGLYLDPPERALVLCLDEKSQILGLGPNRSDFCRCGPGCQSAKSTLRRNKGFQVLRSVLVAGMTG